MKKKGFTLIELLAVIIILAVIALIATPIILNVVDNAKESARQASVSGYADTGKLAVTEYQFGHGGETPKLDQAFIDTIKPQGDKVVCGQDGETPGVYYSNQYGIVLHGCKVGNHDKLYYFASGKTYTKDNDGKLPEEYMNIMNGIKGPQISDVVYFNPVANQVCTDYAETNSSTGVKTGCMKWYVYKTDGENIGLLLDHSTTSLVYWNTNKSNIMTQLASDTNTWNNGLDVDLIDSYDIAKITGYEKTNGESWAPSKLSYYFDTNSKTPSDTCQKGNTVDCKYGWLYDRTANICKDYGCLNNTEGTTMRGYWTKNDSIYSDAWGVYYLGMLSNTNASSIRPVISIPKSLIK